MRIALTVAAFLLFSLILAGAEPFVGKWKLNVEKTRLAGNDTRLVSETIAMSRTGPNIYRIVTDSVSKPGQHRRLDLTHISDGNEHFPDGFRFQRLGESETYKQIDELTRKLTRKRNGQIIGEITSTVSADGQVMTEHQFYPVERVYLFEKQ
jgi:hypothetical protein